MKFLIVVLSLTQCGHFARASALEEVMKIVDQKNISSMEELLPELSYDMRSNFVLINDSRSLQNASLDKPRVVMFGKDAKFIAAFNGDVNSGGYSRLEMIQFNDSENKFEFFDLPFPIVRDSAGLAVRPHANPTQCLRCHGDDPHPIWASYNVWPGVYGTNDDFLEGEELTSLETFLNGHQSMSRYQALKPLTGSALSPFSYEKRGNFKFRPNLRFGQLLSRLNAKKLARQIRASGQFKKYASLWAYETDRGGGGIGFYGCESLSPTKPIYDGLWTPEDGKKLQLALESERVRRFPLQKPIPEKWNLLPDLYFLFTNESQYGEWGLDLELGAMKANEFQNGNSPLRNHVMHELLTDFYGVIPELKNYAVIRSRYAEDVPNSRLVRTPFDLEFLKIVDAMNMKVSMKSTGEHCRMLIEKIKKDWF